MKEEIIKEKIIEILKKSQPLNPLYEPNYEFWAKQILELFQAHNQDLLERIEETIEKNIANTQTQTGKVRIWGCESIIIVLESLKNKALEDIKKLI